MSGDFFAQLAAAAIQASVDFAVQYALSELTNKKPETPKTFATIKQPVPPRHFAYGRGRKPGVFALWVSVDGYTIDVLSFCHGRIGGNWAFYLHDDAVTLDGSGHTLPGLNDRYGEFITIAHREGLPTETAYAEVMARTPSWTEAHRGDHTASAAVICKMVKSEKMAKIYPNGQVETSAVADWLCVYDWRDETQDRTDPATWQWSDNPIVCWVHDEWARNACFWDHEDETLAARERTIADRTWQRRFAPTLDILTEEADACDEVLLGQKRYTCFVWYEANTDRKSVREMFKRSCDGWMVERGDGAYVFRCGRYVGSPTAIDDAVLVDLPMMRAGVAKSELINDLQLRFRSPDNAWEIVDTTPFTDEASIARRGRKTEVLEMPETTNNVQARRLGKSAFEALKAKHRGTMRLDLDRVGEDLFDYRFHTLMTNEGSSAFRSMDVEFMRAEVNYLERTIEVDYRSVTPERYVLTLDEVGPGPTGSTPPTPGEIPVPELLDDGVFDGGAIRFTLNGPLPNESLTPVVQWWPTDNPAAVTTVDSDLFTGPDDDFYIYSASLPGATPGVGVLTAQVAYRSGRGILGDFTTPSLISVDAPPYVVSPPTELVLTPGTGTAKVSWREPAVLPAYEIIRHNTTNTMTGATALPNVTPIAPSYLRDVDVPLSAGVHYVFITAYDAADIASATISGSVTVS